MVVLSGGDETLNVYFASQLRALQEGEAKFPSCDGFRWHFAVMGTQSSHV